MHLLLVTITFQINPCLFRAEVIWHSTTNLAVRPRAKPLLASRIFALPGAPILVAFNAADYAKTLEAKNDNQTVAEVGIQLGTCQGGGARVMLCMLCCAAARIAHKPAH